MKQKLFCLIALCIPLFVLPQTKIAGEGIQWTQGFSWEQVKSKAKKENKYIFVDCYATWCKPCKAMDREVYTMDTVGSFLNAGFISIKLQMDQTKDDDVSVKSWYKTASFFAKEYNLYAYPTMLFFTPAGEVATKEVGYKDPAGFIQVARNAKDPSKQYFVLLKNYKKGKLDDLQKRSLINTAKQLGDTANYHMLLADYYSYLHSLKKEQLYTKENIEFIASTLSHSNQLTFTMFYPHGREVNDVMQDPWYAQKVVDHVIEVEKLRPFFKAESEKTEPEWTLLYNAIAKDYAGDYADRNVLQAKLMWYGSGKDALPYATLFNDKMEKYGSDTTDMGEDFILNNQAFLLWQKIGDITELKRMAAWMAGVVRRGEKATGEYIQDWPLYIDTYANLLYKVGETSEALKWQEMAVVKAKELDIDKSFKEAIQENFEMMKKGLPTWPVPAGEEKKSSSLKTQTDATQPDQYMWSFAKNKAIPNPKAMIDFKAIDSWKGVGNTYLAVSDDGKYFAYNIYKPAQDVRYAGNVLNQLDSLIIQSTDGSWRMAFAVSGTGSGLFTSDSKRFIFFDEGILYFLGLGNLQFRQVKDVASFKISQNKWLAYKLKSHDSLILQSLLTQKEKYFTGVKDYLFDNSGNWLSNTNSVNNLVLYNLETGSFFQYPFVSAYSISDSGKSLLIKTSNSLQFISLSSEAAKSIFSIKEKASISSYAMDVRGEQVAFSVYDSTNDKTSIWLYSATADKTVSVVTDNTPRIPDGLEVMSNIAFTDNGRYIRFNLQATPETKPMNPDIAQVEVWSHQDIYLQAAQEKKVKQLQQFQAVVNVENGKVNVLERSGEKLYLIQGDYAVLQKNEDDRFGDRFWDKKNEDSTWIVSLKDGGNYLLPTSSANSQFWFSPSGNFLVFSDPNKGFPYFSYELQSGEVRNISSNVAKGQFVSIDRIAEHSNGSNTPGIAAWIANDGGVLVYDNYDIWKLDLTGQKPAIDITSAFGREQHIIFSLFSSQRNNRDAPTIEENEPLLLEAFNTETKQNGFYEKRILNAAAPVKLCMGDYFFEEIQMCHDANFSNRGMAPVKANNAKDWIVQRQSVADAPNFYETRDFRTFKKLTDYQPQKNFRWFTEELHNFNCLNGQKRQGILYKPEDFDSTKKYPVLIIFYQNFPDTYNQFRDPALNYEALTPGGSPAWFINNGYLVFTPEIHVSPLKYGQDAFNIIEGAAKYLEHLPFVDANKLGYGAHSWSAKLGAYIFTHSTSFSAVSLTEGLSYANMTSTALSVEDGNSKLKNIEVDMQYGSLWDNKTSWLDQTTVLNVDKARSPLLLLCNKGSSDEYQIQTAQLFTALRRLNKNVWWLRYEDGDHDLRDYLECKDYTIRYTQFFDHYLKEAPAPQWMTQGVPYKLKGIESRYELDPAGKCNDTNGEPCPICEAWNKQFKRTPEMFKKEIRDWALDADIAAELDRKIAERRKVLDKEQEVTNKKIVDILKNGYPKYKGATD